MANNFISGDKCAVKAANGTITPAQSWNLTIDGKPKEVSNSRDGRKRIRGRADASGTFTLAYDMQSGAQPTDPAGANLADGTVVTLQLFTDSTANKFYQLSAIIENIKPGIGGFDDALMFEVAFSLESGSVTYPVLP